MINKDELYAVVWHQGGRIDCEPLAMLLAKNAIELKPGANPRRAVLDVCETVNQAGTKAHEFRIKLKNESDQIKQP